MKKYTDEIVELFEKEMTPVMTNEKRGEIRTKLTRILANRDIIRAQNKLKRSVPK